MTKNGKEDSDTGPVSEKPKCSECKEFLIYLPYTKEWICVTGGCPNNTDTGKPKA